MRSIATALVLIVVQLSVAQSPDSAGPNNEKAIKTYQQALKHVQERKLSVALDEFKRADKQDGGKCRGCQDNIVHYGVQLQDWKAAEKAAEEMVAQAQGDQAIALAHYQLGFVHFREGLLKHKEDLFGAAHQEMATALAAYSNFPSALFADGQALARLHQDDAAKAQFEAYLRLNPKKDLDRRRAMRFIAQPELARARMAPPFSLSTQDGQRVSLDDLQGKVVLLDFWATWCGPCRAALPHMRDIARKFQAEPLVILSISLDDDEQKWKDFVQKNEMTWLQYRDGGFDGPVASLFSVHAIPSTFTIDADGVLQDEHIGDASVEGKLKKLVARARESQIAEKTP